MNPQEQLEQASERIANIFHPEFSQEWYDHLTFKQKADFNNTFLVAQSKRKLIKETICTDPYLQSIIKSCSNIRSHLEAIRLQTKPGSHENDNAINGLKIIDGEIKVQPPLPTEQQGKIYSEEECIALLQEVTIEDGVDGARAVIRAIQQNAIASMDNEVWKCCEELESHAAILQERLLIGCNCDVANNPCDICKVILNDFRTSQSKFTSLKLKMEGR
jgi:hypothetical protein